jgi:hypothetical protein
MARQGHINCFWHLFFEIRGVIRSRRSAFASLLLVGVSINPSDPEDEKNASAFFEM